MSAIKTYSAGPIRDSAVVFDVMEIRATQSWGYECFMLQKRLEINYRLINLDSMIMVQELNASL